MLKNAINIIQMALALVPSIMALVQAVELPGSGADKKQAVIDLLTAAFDILPDDLKAQIGGNKIIAFAGTVINILVTLLNKTGVFPKGK